MKPDHEFERLCVTLAAPPADYTRALYGFRTRRPYRNQPPLGIGYVAAVLRQKGASVRILDCAAEGWDHERAAGEILASDPELVGLTAITFEAPSAFEVARRIKARGRTPIVLGGAHANSYYPSVLRDCTAIDAVVAGDGEATMVEFCRRFRAGEPPDGVPGLIARRADGTASAFQERPPLTDLDSLPSPAYDLYPHSRYRPLPHRAKRLPSSCMITSRGCAYAKCTYCELSGLVRRTYRRHSPGRVIDEMRQVIRLTGAREIYFQDDYFVSDTDWVAEFCDRLSAGGPDVIWSCESRFQGVSRELMARMRKAGCWRIYFGFESGNQALLDRIQKGFRLEEARQAARDANAAGLDVVGFFMLGLPGETPADGEETIRFSLGLGLGHVVYSLTVPQPNTELYRLCKDEGTIVPGNEYYYKTANFIPRDYRSARQLESLRAKAFRRFYLRPGYWLHCLRRIRSLDDARYYLSGFLSLFRYLD